MADEPNRSTMRWGGGRMGLGQRPLLLVVDVQRGFTDPRSPLGATADDMVDHLRQLIADARDAAVPIVYTACIWSSEASTWARKIPAQRTLQHGSTWVELDARLDLRPEEDVVEKHHASAFFRTPVDQMLQQREIDTVLITGMTTSGCVRASVVDACSYGYHVAVPEEAVADRDPTSHAVSLRDMDAKYADVMPCAEVSHYLATLPAAQKTKQ